MPLDFSFEKARWEKRSTSATRSLAGPKFEGGGFVAYVYMQRSLGRGGNLDYKAAKSPKVAACDVENRGKCQLRVSAAGGGRLRRQNQAPDRTR